MTREENISAVRAAIAAGDRGMHPACASLDRLLPAWRRRVPMK